MAKVSYQEIAATLTRIAEEIENCSSAEEAKALSQQLLNVSALLINGRQRKSNPQ